MPAASKKLRVVTAESCTGGLIAGALTAIAGSSDVVDRAFVTYSNEAKREMIGVPWDAILGHGAVSEPVARAMAAGALARAQCRRSRCRSPASPARAAARPTSRSGWCTSPPQRAGYDAIVERHVFPGDRDQIRRLTVVTALAMVAALAERSRIANLPTTSHLCGTRPMPSGQLRRSNCKLFQTDVRPRLAVELGGARLEGGDHALHRLGEQHAAWCAAAGSERNSNSSAKTISVPLGMRLELPVARQLP